MKVLITGGFGYIGTTLTKHLLNNTKHDIVIVDRLDYNVNDKFLDEVIQNKRIRFIKSDIRNLELLRSLIQKADSVVNLAALVGEHVCNKKKDDAESINFLAARDISNLCSKSNRQIRLVQMSTCSNYGLSEELCNEESPLSPTSTYAKTKVDAESYIISSNPNAIVLRCATAFGLSVGRMRFDLLLNEFVRDAHVNGKITVFDPHVYRPIIHVKDIAIIITHFIETEKTNHNIYNTGSTAYNFKKIELANMVKDFSNVIEVEIINKKDSRNYKVDFSRLEKELDFKPSVSVQEGISEMVNAITSLKVPLYCGNA